MTPEERADQAKLDWERGVPTGAAGPSLTAHIAAAIREAVAAERERCIETIRMVGTDWRVWAACDTTAHFVEKVAAAIRTGEIQT